MEALRYQIIRHFSILSKSKVKLLHAEILLKSKEPKSFGAFLLAPPNQHDLPEEKFQSIMTTHGDSEVLERTCWGPGIRCPSTSSEKNGISDRNGWLKAGRTWSRCPKEDIFFCLLAGVIILPIWGIKFYKSTSNFQGISLIIMHGLGW